MWEVVELRPPLRAQSRMLSFLSSHTSISYELDMHLIFLLYNVRVDFKHTATYSRVTESGIVCEDADESW